MVSGLVVVDSRAVISVRNRSSGADAGYRPTIKAAKAQQASGQQDQQQVRQHWRLIWPKRRVVPDVDQDIRRRSPFCFCLRAVTMRNSAVTSEFCTD